MIFRSQVTYIHHELDICSLLQNPVHPIVQKNVGERMALFGRTRSKVIDPD